VDGFSVSSDKVKVYLLQALAAYVELGIGDAVWNIDKMMICFCDLLASNIPQPLLHLAITALVGTYHVYSNHLPTLEYLEILINCLREVNRHLVSHDPYVAMQLALHLSKCFREMNSMHDYKEAMAFFDKVITSKSNRDCPGPLAAGALFFSVIITVERVGKYRNPEYLEEAIHSHCKFLRIPSTNHYNRSIITWGLANLMRACSSHFGITGEGHPEPRSPGPAVTSF